MHDRARRRARQQFLVRVEEPIHEAVGRLGRGRRARPGDPLLRQKLAVFPLAVAQGEIAEPAHVIGVDEHSAAPMSAAGDGLHGRAVEHDPGIFIAVPAPGVAGADRVHDVVLEHLRQRTPPYAQRRQRQRVDPHVVVFVDAARRVARPGEPLRGIRLGPVCPVRLAPQGAFPVAHLPQHVIPRDRAIVRGLERREQIGDGKALGLVATSDRIVDLHRRHIFAYGIVDAADQAAVVGNSHDAREKAFRDAVRHVDPRRLAPLRDEVTVANDQAGRIAAVLDRADCLAKRLAAEGLIMVELEIARVLGFARDGKVDGLLERSRVQADIGGTLFLPAAIRVIDRSALPCLAGLRQRRGCIYENEKGKQSDALTTHNRCAPAWA